MRILKYGTTHLHLFKNYWLMSGTINKLFRHRCQGMNNSEEPKSPFQCNICFDTASDPVVTFCGHLYWFENS